MAPLENLYFPLLNKVSGGVQSLEIDSTATKLVSSVDASFAGVDVSDLASRTQKITSDGSATFITGDLNCDSSINLRGRLFNIDSETKISDHLLVQADGGSDSAVVIENSNNISDPLVVKHAGSPILSLAIDGTITNSNIQTIESGLATEISDRTTAVSDEQTTRIAGDAALQSNIDTLTTSVNATTTSLQNQITQEIANREQDVIDETNARTLAIDSLQSDIDDLSAEVQTNNAAQQAEIDAVEVRCDDLEEATQLLTSTADVATFSGKVAWGAADSFFCIKRRVEETLAGVATMTKALDMSHLYSIDGVSTNKIASYEVVVQDKAGSVQSPYFLAKLIVGSDGAVLVPVTSFKVSTSSFDYTTNELTLNFSESVSKTLVISWVLLS